MNYLAYAVTAVLCLVCIVFVAPYLISQANTIMTIIGFAFYLLSGFTLGVMLYDVLEDITKTWRQ